MLLQINVSLITLKKVAKSDCLGVCSQQYNVDIEACDLGLAIGVAGAVLGGAMSAGMAGAGIWMTVAAGYLVCENAAIGSLDTCGSRVRQLLLSLLWSITLASINLHCILL